MPERRNTKTRNTKLLTTLTSQKRPFSQHWTTTCRDPEYDVVDRSREAVTTSVSATIVELA